MRRYGIMLFALLGLSALTAQPSHAMTWGGEVFAAFNTYAMDDWNDFIDAANQNGANADEISNGISGGLGVRMWPNANWMISACWEPMFASTEDDVSGDEIG